jgi:hypothetical protein
MRIELFYNSFIKKGTFFVPLIKPRKGFSPVTGKEKTGVGKGQGIVDNPCVE